MFKVYDEKEIQKAKKHARMSLDKTGALILRLLDSEEKKITIDKTNLLRALKDVDEKIEVINDILEKESLECEITFKCK